MTLKAFMEARGLTLAVISEKSGVPANTLSRFMTGANELSPKNIIKLVNYTGGLVSFEDLVREGQERRGAER